MDLKPLTKIDNTQKEHFSQNQVRIKGKTNRNGKTRPMPNCVDANSHAPVLSMYRTHIQDIYFPVPAHEKEHLQVIYHCT